MGLGSGFGYGGSTIDKTNYNKGNSLNDTANNSYNKRRSSNRSSRNSGRSNNRSSSFSRPTLNYESDKNSILNNAPNKQVTQSYKLAENPNPFMKDVLSMGQKYNTYQRQVANPEYNDYINKNNNEYNNKYSNFRWGNYNWNNLEQNDFKNEQLKNGIYEETQNFNTVQNKNYQNGQSNDFWNRIGTMMGPSGTLSLAKQALFG